MKPSSETQKSKLTKQKSVDILFKGLKRQVSERQYLKIKNSYKKKPIQNLQIQTQQPSIPTASNRTKLKLSVVSNKITDPQYAYDQLLKLKEANHKLFQQNTELLRKIRKQQKIQEIYRKKLQGRELIELDYYKIMEIKLLLQVERLQNDFEEKQKLYEKKIQTLKAKKNLFKDEIIQKKTKLYQIMINSLEESTKILKEKKATLNEKQQKIDRLKQKFIKAKCKKNEQMQTLNEIKNYLTKLKQKFKVQQALSKQDSSNLQMIRITNLMSSLIIGSQRSPIDKQASTAILKNNMSSISTKNKNSTQQLQKQIQKIKEEYESVNNQIQQFMNQKIKQKILINKEIFAIQEEQKQYREKENRKNMFQNNVALVKQDFIKSSNNSKPTISMKNSIVISS